MACFLEHLLHVRFVVDIFVIPLACTDVRVIYQNGASVHTLHLNQNVLKENGKFQKKQAMIIFLRYMLRDEKPPTFNLDLFYMSCSEVMTIIDCDLSVV